MWICMTDSFLSVVVYDKDPTKFKVRARRKEHISKLFPDAEVIADVGTDYKYRAFIPKEDVIDVVLDKLENMPYTRFKHVIKDMEMYTAYCAVWNDMKRIQR